MSSGHFRIARKYLEVRSNGKALGASSVIAFPFSVPAIPIRATERPPSGGLFGCDIFSVLTTCRAYSGLPAGTCVWTYRIDLCAVARIERIVERSIVLVRCAWREAFIVTGATIHPAIVLTRKLTTILPGAKSVLRASILLGDRGS
jgi:hypothetical protein